jgi:hypothetical protein
MLFYFSDNFKCKKWKNISTIDQELLLPKPKPTCPSEFFTLNFSVNISEIMRFVTNHHS